MSGSRKIKAPEEPGLLHVYGQAWYHDEAYLVGNGKGLKAVRDAIDEVLAGEKDQSATWVSASDGEGYDVRIMRVDDPWSMNVEFDGDGEIAGWRPGAPEGSRWERIAYPYTDEEWGKEERKDALWPSKFWNYGYAMPPLTVTVAEYIGDRAADAPLVDEGSDLRCPLCGMSHPTYVIDGTDGERLLVFRCIEKRGENELIAGFSDGDRFRLVAQLFNGYE